MLSDSLSIYIYTSREREREREKGEIPRYSNSALIGLSKHLQEEWHSFAGRVADLNALVFPFLHGRLQHRGDHRWCPFHHVSMCCHQPISSFDGQVMRILCPQGLFPQLCDALVDGHSPSNGMNGWVSQWARGLRKARHRIAQEIDLRPKVPTFVVLVLEDLMPCVHKGNGTAALAVHLSFVVLLRETDPGFSTSAFLCYARPRTDQPFNWVERTLTSFNWAQNCALNIRDQHSLSTYGAGAPIKSVQVKLLQVLQRVGTSQQSPEKLRLCHFANSHRSGPSCKDWLSCLINYFQAQRRARKRVEHWISCGHWTYWTNSWFNWDLASSSNRIPVS